MLNWLRNLLITEDDNDPAFVSLLRNILIIILVILALLIVTQSGVLTSAPQFDTLATLTTVAILTAYFVYLVNRKILWPGKVFLPTAILISVTYFIATANGLHDVALISFPIAIFTAGLLIGRRSLLFWALAASACVVFVGYWDMAGYTPEPVAKTTGFDTIAVAILIIFASAGIGNALLSRFEKLLSASRKNEQEQILVNKELRELQETLEQRVNDRTEELENQSRELEIANRGIRRRAAQFEALAQVTQSITSIRDLKNLLPLVANVISEKFGFYHVGIFLLDEANEYAILSAANSEGGKRMLERNHHLRVGEQGIVGNVTATGNPRVAMDVGADAVFFNNPDLEDTHSEMALPLRSGMHIIGALDVQSTEKGAFANEDIQMLNLLADQVSLAIENARLFDETRRSLAEAEAFSRQFLRESWGRLTTEQKMLGYRYNITGAAPLDESGDLTEPAQDKNKRKPSEANQVAVPLELRGEAIGTLYVQLPFESKLDQDQLDLIKAVAERVALSAENARLFEETTRTAERERMVADITTKIRRTNDPQKMIETAVQELQQVLGASHVEIVPQKIAPTSEK